MEDMIDLGRVGELGAKSVELDLSEFSEFGSGEYHLLHQRANDTGPYEVDDIQVSGGKLIWNVSAFDTAYVGVGKAEIRLQGDDFLVKSDIYLTRVYAALER